MLQTLRTRALTPVVGAPCSRSLRALPPKIQSFRPVWFPSPLEQSPSTEMQKLDGLGRVEDDSAREQGRLKRRQQRSTVEIAIHPRVCSRRAAVHERPYLRRLNKHLAKAEHDRHDDKNRKLLWKAYCHAKKETRGILHRIPDRAWDLLWSTQAIDSETNPGRDGHLRQLYHDMRSIGRTTSLAQRIQYLEAMFTTGEEVQALNLWEDEHTLEEAYKPEHLEIGARMHAMIGNADRAKLIMDELFDLYPSWDSTTILSVFRAHTQSSTTCHHDTAWDLYNSMQDRFHMGMTREHYQICFTGFLQTRNLQYTKAVFKDMVTNGRLACSLDDDEIREVLRKLNFMYRLGQTMDEMTDIATFAISVLPQPYHYHIFGDWLKFAAIMKAPLTAARVLDFMYQRGLKPETMHFNVLIAAFLHSQDQAIVKKVENIGWQMVEVLRATPRVVHRATTRPRSEYDFIRRNAIFQTTAREDGELPIERTVSPANATTFSHLLHHHNRKAQWEHTEYLRTILDELELPPNTALMNSLMQNDLKQMRLEAVFRNFQGLTDGLTDNFPLFPNGATWRCLWKTLRLSLADYTMRDVDVFPHPRQLLADFVTWWDQVKLRLDRGRFLSALNPSGSGHDLSGWIMHCFGSRRKKDLAGGLVAMHVLRSRFGIFPSDRAVQILGQQLAWIELQENTQELRARYHRAGVFETNKKKIARVHHILLQRRLKRLNISAAEFAQLSPTQVGEMNLNHLTELIRTILVRQYSAGEVERMIDLAKTEIGVSDLSIGDVDAFNVA